MIDGFFESERASVHEKYSNGYHPKVLLPLPFKLLQNSVAWTVQLY